MTAARPSREDRWEEILDCAAQVLAEQSLEGTKLADIAARLGIRQQALYHYVASRDELYFAVLAREMDRAQQALESIETTRPGADQLRALFAGHVKVIAGHPALFRLFYGGGLASLPEDRRRELKERERRYVAMFKTSVEDAIRLGQLPEVDPRIAADTLLGMATWTYQWLRPEYRDDPEPIIQQMLRLIAFSEENS